MRTLVVLLVSWLLAACSSPPTAPVVAPPPVAVPTIAEVAVEPIFKTIELQVPVVHGGTQTRIGIMIHRVEIDKQETRVVASVNNMSSQARALVSESNALLVQGSHQVARRTPAIRDSDPLPNSILPGVIAPTTLVFGAIDPDGPPLRLVWDSVRFSVDGRTDSYPSYTWEIPLDS